MNKETTLNWSHDEETGIHTAYDNLARYVISVDQRGKFQIGFFPAPGPETIWRDGLESVEDAKSAAIDCAKQVHDVRKELI